MNKIAQLSLCGLLLTAAHAQAASFNNGTFTDLSSWGTLGDVSAHGGRAWLTTASVEFEDDFPALAGAFNLSGSSAAGIGGAASVETYIGLTPGALDPDLNNGIAAYEGSALQQSFSAAAGDKLSFQWQLFSNEGQGGMADYAFIVIDGQKIDLATATAANTASGVFGFAYESGVASYTHTFGQAGQHTLAFGVADVNDYNVTTALAVSNVQVTAVPEPEQYALLLAGLGLVGAAARRRRI